MTEDPHTAARAAVSPWQELVQQTPYELEDVKPYGDKVDALIEKYGMEVAIQTLGMLIFSGLCRSFGDAVRTMATDPQVMKAEREKLRRLSEGVNHAYKQKRVRA